jgi:SNF2 family DNA or RNA helicase
MELIMWQNLFYDKYAGDNCGNGDHHYNNPITNKVSINDLEDGSYEIFIGQDAQEKYNQKFKGHFMLPEDIHLSELMKLKMYRKNSEGIETIYLVVALNINMLEKLIIEKSHIPKIDFIKMLCRYHLAYTETTKFITNSYFYNNFSMTQKIEQNMKYITENALKPVDYTFDSRVDKIDELNIDLFEYQKCSISWMIDKETNKKTISYNLNDEVSLGNIYYDTCTQTFNPIHNRKSLTFYGGAVIDEVGLGKTLEVIGLCLKNPAISTSYKSNKYPNKFFAKGTLVLCPNQLCGQWIRELKDKIKPESDIKVISFLTKRDFDKYSYNDILDADFVVVSFTFIDNKSFTSPWVSKISSYKNYHKKIWASSDHNNVQNHFESLSSELTKDPINSLFKKNPLFQLIHWHRLVIDEFHEIYKSNTPFTYISNLLPYIKSDNKWCITATPFNQKKTLYEIINFLTDYKNIDDSKIFTVEQFVDYFSFQCFRRNTKDSVKMEHTLPPINEEIRWLKFSPTERMIYNAYLTDHNNSKYSVYLRQLCCHPQLAEETKEVLSNCKTLEDIENMMLTHYKLQVTSAEEIVDKFKKRIAKIKENISELEEKLKKKKLKKIGVNTEKEDFVIDKELEKLLESLNAESNGKNSDKTDTTLTIENLKEHLKNQENKLVENTNILEGKKSTYNFFYNVIERIKKTVNKVNKPTEGESNDDEVCGICLDEIPENDIGVTKCGHIFCYECLRLTITKYHTCPYCKNKLSEQDIYILSYERKKKDQNTSAVEKDKISLINDIGTKLANLILYLRESGEHTIIFSQWDDLLRRVGRILKENSIPNVFCKGNCYQRDKAIREFNSDDKIKVIMLSSDSTAAGTNLTKASQVIFIDPIYGDYKYRKDQERQAIGRAHRLGQKAKIKIIRFIIQDSIEEEIYQTNLIEDNKHAHDYETLQEIHIA